MKTLIIAASLLLGSAAYAQTPPEPDPTAVPPEMPAGEAMPQPTDPAMPPADAANPMPSEPMPPATTAPPPANPNAAPMAEAPSAAPQPAKDYPLCTRKLKDNCMNPSERPR